MIFLVFVVFLQNCNISAILPKNSYPITTQGTKILPNFTTETTLPNGRSLCALSRDCYRIVLPDFNFSKFGQMRFKGATTVGKELLEKLILLFLPPAKGGVPWGAR